ncbi:MAG: ubiquinol-cytochrome C chaperone [Rickettsiales bacterium]|nr:ubiquinol-cytochrome C chaperone [Rickettsiales bacterium]
MFLKAFREKKERKNSAHSLYETIILQSRKPYFYQDYQVPDTVDGRFEVLIFHVFLVIERIKKEDKEKGYALNQELFDLVFRDMDQNLRQIGIGDVTVPKHIKKMAKAFYGRSVAYLDGLRGLKDNNDPQKLYDAFDRNIFAKVKNVDKTSLEFFKDYLQMQKEYLEKKDYAEIEKGVISFKQYP